MLHLCIANMHLREHIKCSGFIQKAGLNTWYKQPCFGCCRELLKVEDTVLHAEYYMHLETFKMKYKYCKIHILKSRIFGGSQLLRQWKELQQPDSLASGRLWCPLGLQPGPLRQ